MDNKNWFQITINYTIAEPGIEDPDEKILEEMGGHDIISDILTDMICDGVINPNSIMDKEPIKIYPLYEDETDEISKGFITYNFKSSCFIEIKITSLEKETFHFEVSGCPDFIEP